MMEMIQLDNIFKHYKRNSKTKNIVMHESCGTCSSNAIATSLRLGHGYHFMVDYDGSVIRCNDPAGMVYHAVGMNNQGIGVLIVNPYAPKFTSADLPYEFIPAKWWTWCPNKNDRRYVLPFPKQIESAIRLVDFLCKEYAVPFEFPTLGTRKKVPAQTVRPGVVAHRDFGKHSDGRYVLEAVAINEAQRSYGVKTAIYQEGQTC